MPEDVWQSLAELHEPGGCARAGRWLLVALIYAALGAGLYFGSVEADCQSDCSRRSSARCQRRATVLLATLGWQVCRQLTGFRGSEGLARVLVGGHAKGDGHATPAGWVAIVGRTTMRGGRNEGGGGRRR